MEMKELLKFIDVENQRLITLFGHLYSTDTERVFARALKLNEEVGELCSELLAFNGDQRKDKLFTHNHENLREEFADIIITTLLLSKLMNIDIQYELRKKIDKINKRYE